MGLWRAPDCARYVGGRVDHSGSSTHSIRGADVTDELDVDLNDPELIAEIILVTDLMVAGSESAGALSQTTIDTLLTTSAAAEHS
jgi:hypothetical protein